MSLSRQAFCRAVLTATAAACLFGAASVSEAMVAPRTGKRMPAPMTGEQLLAPAGASYGAGESDKTCLTPGNALAMLFFDTKNFGGRIVVLRNGTQQEFSNAWRGLVGGRRVEVSLVLAHMFVAPGGDPAVDVVEFGIRGCVVSRTRLSIANFIKLIRLAHTIEA